MTREPVLKTEKLTHIYSEGTPFEMAALRGVDMEVLPGEFLGIIGHTGSGKSTLIQHLNGLIQPTSGSVFFKGEDIFASKELTHALRFHVGLVFQYPEYQLFDETVYKDIAFGPRNMKLGSAEIDERVHEAAGFAGVSEEMLEKSPFELSGGQKRRVAIAGVIAMRPEVLILDEPTAGLDPEGCRDIFRNLVEYRNKTGSAIVMVTHSMEDAARYADRLVVINEGKAALSGTPDEVFSHARELRDMGLELPAATVIAEKLRELGVPLRGSLYTVDRLRDAILDCRRESRA